MVSSAETWCGGASSRRDPSSMPAGKASQTGYQYDSISRVAGHRELAPPSNFSNEGGFRKSVFKVIDFPSIQWIILRKSGARPTNFSIRKVPVVAVGRRVIAV